MKKKLKEIVFEIGDKLYVKRYSPSKCRFTFVQFTSHNGWLLNATVISATKFFHNLRIARATNILIKTNHIIKPKQK